MMNEEDKNMLDDLVQDFCRRAQLYGCDAVQVLLSSHDEAKEMTRIQKYGRGNWYSRQGMAREFLSEDEARTAEHLKRTEFGEDDG